MSTQHPDTRARRVRTRPASARPGRRPVLLAVVLVAAAALALLGADRTGGEVAAPVHDDDGDGVAGARDACPEAPGLEPDGCPPRDGDGDGVLDFADPCPAQAGPEVNRGCPDRDGDGDGVVERRDRCPAQRGHAEAAGCVAPDGDGDAIRDAADACPDRAEVWNGRRDRDGCPDAGSAVLGVQPGRIELGPGRWFRRSGGLSSDGREAVAVVADVLAAAAARSVRIEVTVGGRASRNPADAEALVARAREQAEQLGRALAAARPGLRVEVAPGADGAPGVRLAFE